jgi:glutamyl-tRNA synthetase
VVPNAPAIRCRVAPSPTGDPHVGTGYAALLNLAFAHSQGGTMLLRIEDTDRSREVAGGADLIMDSLRWLRLGWDEGPDIGGPYAPYRQSERLPRYREVSDQLLASGHAYLCWCTTERLAEMRDHQLKAKRPTGYDRLCHGKTREERELLPGFNPDPVVRMFIDGPLPKVQDMVRGDVSSPDPDDQVILKADGFPTYHLASVVDDHDMQISHVIRGEEWISSTVKHLLLYRWLDWPAPEFLHFSLLRNADRSKISKRKNPAARLGWFQEEGILPEALVNFLALMGYSMPDQREIFTLDEMIAEFDFRRLNTAGPVFDLDKLDWLNGHYIRALSDDEFWTRVTPFLPSWAQDEDLHWVTQALKERLKRLARVGEELVWLHDPEVPRDAETLLRKGLERDDAIRFLDELAERLLELTPFEPAQIEETVSACGASLELQRRRMFMTARVAATGGPVSPPLHETIAVLGRDRTVTRLRQAAESLRTASAVPGSAPSG